AGSRRPIEAVIIAFTNFFIGGPQAVRALDHVRDRGEADRAYPTFIRKEALAPITYVMGVPAPATCGRPTFFELRAGNAGRTLGVPHVSIEPQRDPHPLIAHRARG